MASSNKRVFLDGITTGNPVLVSLLGLCPALAISTSIDNAIGMTIALVVVLLLSNVTISLMRKIIPSDIRIPIEIIVVATFVSCVDMLMHAFMPSLYSSLGIFIPLIVVNCIILGRAEAFAIKESVGRSALDGLGTALGYGLSLFLISFIRELLATQSITLSNPFNNAQSFTLHLIESAKISFFGDASGAFVVLGLIIATTIAIREHKANKAAKLLAEKKKVEAEKAAQAALINKANQEGSEVKC
ncbi:MAG: electron transport complex subunit RsxE [Bacilli bacterium]|nr:electron transport complex subunit RsxE [Bacilli bacterium]